uniref:RWD domain-containing protein n=1 Tax=Pundamilia nyererei TaxID=303518 RepID=A0A3B4ET76_9CICH
MSSQRTSADGTDDCAVRQENELEALASIFEDDFKDLRSNDPWKVKRPPEVYLCLRPNGLNTGQECYVTVDLHVKCPPTYPDGSSNIRCTGQSWAWQGLQSGPLSSFGKCEGMHRFWNFI